MNKKNNTIMRYINISIVFLATLLFSCSNNKKESEEGLFDYSEPVDLSYILKAYDQQKNGGDEDIDKELFPDMPEDGLNLFEDTSFVLHVPDIRPIFSMMMMWSSKALRISALTSFTIRRYVKLPSYSRTLHSC